MKEEVIELLSDDEENDNHQNTIDTPKIHSNGTTSAESGEVTLSEVKYKHHVNPYLSDKSNLSTKKHDLDASSTAKRQPKKRKCPAGSIGNTTSNDAPLRRQAGLVLEEDVNECPPLDEVSRWDGENDANITISADIYIEQQQSLISEGQPLILFEDSDFCTLPSSIRGPKKDQKKITCRCKGSTPAKLDYKETKEPGLPYKRLQPYYRCAKNRCKFYSNAFYAERFHWYRFGIHTGHTLVGTGGFAAKDLCQGRVGDCWFLSALAVVAERPDLILRLFGNGNFTQLNDYGICQVKLFLDGYWKTVVVDSFLPCLIDGPSESQLHAAIQASSSEGKSVSGTGRSLRNGQLFMSSDTSTTSKYNVRALSDQCRQVLRDTREFLEQDLAKNRGTAESSVAVTTEPIHRLPTSEDLAYSKAKSNQLWVPLLEKAYAKSHGSYQAISGGHIAEAFLDLTGAPTLVYEFFTDGFQPRQFWKDLMKFQKQRLPMGCGTSQSQVGIIGMHAYSILDVVEVKNVSYQFFQETGVGHGNVSGFTDFDGTVRLLQIRNPHGKSEWKGEFSDHSDVWEKLVQHQYQGGQRFDGVPVTSGDEMKASSLKRTMRNDGVFWIDYDSFLQGFSNVDVVLAFLGNHAKSFSSNFPPKKSNQRCMRAFEVSLIDEGPQARDKVELYIMGIQKTRRGAGHGRMDRKVSYKLCDLGMLVGETPEDPGRDIFDSDWDDDENYWLNRNFSTVRGQMFGFQRNGHYRLVLDRTKHKTMVVMPVSFGHPAATDKQLSFVLRFVSDAPLLIKELPAVPRLDRVIQKFCLGNALSFSSKQGIQSVLLEGPNFRLVQIDCLGNDGGTVFLYLCCTDHISTKNKQDKEGGLSFSFEARCRGMSCRTQEGLLVYETIAKGKKFEAAWRKYGAEFHHETKSRLLAVLYQSGQDYQFGGVTCSKLPSIRSATTTTKQGSLDSFLSVRVKDLQSYIQYGIFNGLDGNEAFNESQEITSSPQTFATIDTQRTDDLHLQQALAISCGEDTELQRAIELSKQQPPSLHGTEISSDLERAFAESSASSHLLSSSGASKEGDIAHAIRLSMPDSKHPTRPTSQTRHDCVDLTNDALLSTTAISADGKKKKESMSDGGPRTNALSAAEKRRLAAEAALRRFANK